MGVRLLAVLALFSAGALVYGCWLAWAPLGFIVGGAVGLVFSLLYDPDAATKGGPE